MQKQSRYKVHGYLDNVFVTTVFKNKQSAIKYAEKISRSEVYDTETRTVIYDSQTTEEPLTIKLRRNAHLG